MSTSDLLLHPIRLRIVQALVGNPQTPLALKERLGDVAQATMYRHLKALHDGGLLEVVGERKVRGGVENTYAVVESAVQLDEADFADATADEHMGYFLVFLGSLIDSYGAYLDGSEPDLQADGVGYHQVPLWLSDDELTELAGELSTALRSRLSNEPSQDRTRRLISTILMPDARSD